MGQLLDACVLSLRPSSIQHPLPGLGFLAGIVLEAVRCEIDLVYMEVSALTP